MFLNEEFIRLYEELTELNEAKADTQNLIDFAGEELANRFLAIKNRLKAPENDLYYWIKNKTAADLEAIVTSVETTNSKTKAKKVNAEEGAELVQETEHWKIYRITTLAASRQYGRDTKWCVSGIGALGLVSWQTHVVAQGTQLYYLITKGEYDPRGLYCKMAIEYFPKEKSCKVFDQQDHRKLLKHIPYVNELAIPGVTMVDLTFYYCAACHNIVDDGAEVEGADGKLYCNDCFEKLFFLCDLCNKVVNAADKVLLSNGCTVCKECDKKGVSLKCSSCGDKLSAANAFKTAYGNTLCDICYWDDYLPSEEGSIDRFIAIATKENKEDYLFDIDVDIELNQLLTAWNEAKENNKLTFTDDKITEYEKAFYEAAKQLGAVLNM